MYTNVEKNTERRRTLYAADAYPLPPPPHLIPLPYLPHPPPVTTNTTYTNTEETRRRRRRN